MASSRKVGFAVYDSSGAPLGGLTPTFVRYVDDTGVAIAPPTISETVVGSGLYQFTPVFNANKAIHYIIDAGVSAVPRYYDNFTRPEELDVDLIAFIRKLLQNSRTVDGGTFQETVFDDDGVTPINRWNLEDAASVPTTGPNIFKKLKV